MAHTLGLKIGSETISIANFKYAMKTPADAEAETITETVTVRLAGASMAIVTTALQEINRAFSLARSYQKFRSGDPVYIEFQPDGQAAAYRSECLDGRAELEDEALGYPWLNKSVKVFVVWTRRAWWEGPETQLTLTNGSGTGTALTVYNHDDAESGHDNWVEIDHAAVEGDVPAPIRVSMKNTWTEDNVYTQDMYIGHHVQDKAGALSHHWELTAAVRAVGSQINNADASGGDYAALSWSATVETLLARWPITTQGGGALVNLAGKDLNMIARFFSAPAYTDMWTQFKIKDFTSGVTLWEGTWTKLNLDAIQNFGVIRIPPRKVLSYFGYLDLYVSLYGRRNASGTHTLNLDFLQSWPMLRVLENQYSITGNVTFHDDEIEDIRSTTSMNGRSGISTQVPISGKIYLEPGRTQRLYFLQQADDGTAGIARTLEISVWYRPRRLTI